MTVSDNNEVLLKLDLVDRVHKLFKSWGSTDEQAEIAAASQAKRFKFDGVQLTWAATGKSALDDPECKSFYADAGFKFLLPPPKADDTKPQVSPLDVELMRAGNKTAEQRVFLQLGGEKDQAGALAQLELLKVGKHQMNGGGDKSTNPFLTLRDKSGAIVPEQMRKVESMLKALGTAKVAAIARAAGFRLDGTPIPERYR